MRSNKKLERGVENDVCGDHSIGRKAYHYLEGKLSDKEAEEFVAHASECSACLDTVVRWHYESVLEEIDVLMPNNQLENKPRSWRPSNIQTNKRESQYPDRESQPRFFH